MPHPATINEALKNFSENKSLSDYDRLTLLNIRYIEKVLNIGSDNQDYDDGAKYVLTALGKKILEEIRIE